MLPFGKPSGQWFQYGGGRSNYTSKSRQSTMKRLEDNLSREEVFKYLQEIFEIHLCGGRFDVESFLVAQAAIKKALNADISDKQLEEEEEEMRQKKQKEEEDSKVEMSKMTRAERREAMKKMHAHKVEIARRKASGESDVSHRRMGLTEEESNAFVRAFFEITERTGHGRYGMHEVFKEFCHWQRRRLAANGFNCKQVAQRLKKCMNESKGFKCEDEHYEFPALPLVDPYGERRRKRILKERELNDPVRESKREEMRKRRLEKVEHDLAEAQRKTREVMDQTSIARERFLGSVLPLLTEEPKPPAISKSASLPEIVPDIDERPPDFGSLLHSIVHKHPESPKKRRSTLKKALLGTQSLPTLTTNLPAQTDKYHDFQRGSSKFTGTASLNAGAASQRRDGSVQLPAIS